MTVWVVYKTASGQVVGWHSATFDPVDTEHPLPTGCAAILAEDAVDDSAAYIAGSPPAVTARPSPACTLDKSTITANGTDTATLSNIPIGATVAVTDSNDTTTYTINDGTLEITADEPGTITITVTPAFPYKPLTVTVTAS
jgi:hypothetical protein